MGQRQQNQIPDAPLKFHQCLTPPAVGSQMPRCSPLGPTACTSTGTLLPESTGMKELQAHTEPEIWENLGLLLLFLSFISHSFIQQIHTYIIQPTSLE